MALTAMFLLIIGATTNSAAKNTSDNKALPPHCIHLPGVLKEAVKLPENASGISKRDVTTFGDVLLCTSNWTFYMSTRERVAYVQEDSAFDSLQREELVNLHNLYRSSVDPPAADMTMLEWNEELAKQAQSFARRCPSKHGYDSPFRPQKEEFCGQNIYLGLDSSGLHAAQLWYDQRKDYDRRVEMCKVNKNCGHYLQMIWSTTQSVGCGFHACRSDNNTETYSIVCNYFPGGNIVGHSPYEIGRGCSLCAEDMDGGTCFNNTCTSKTHCKKNHRQCSCPLKCENCGQLDNERCFCKCKKGWDGLDCSVPCDDENPLCGLASGIPSSNCVDEKIQRRSCRKTCGRCSSIIQRSNEHCCGGKLCSPGYVLNRWCRCVPKCPGPFCNTSIRLRALLDIGTLSVFISLLKYLTLLVFC